MTPVTVYWRPGCSECARLRNHLRRVGLPTEEVNVWHDQEAAARLRALAQGSETVPMVVVGDVVLINPRPHRAVELISDLLPDLATPETVRRSGRIQVASRVRWAVVAGSLVASLLLDLHRLAGLSWAMDGVAVAAWAAGRVAPRLGRVRRQPEQVGADSDRDGGAQTDVQY